MITKHLKKIFTNKNAHKPPLFTLLSDLDESYKDKWEKQFVSVNRNYLDGVWRRSQKEENKEKSGWQKPSDQRRRMIHVIDGYDLVKNGSGTYDFVIIDSYLWLCNSLPKDEIARYIEKVHKALADGGWNPDGEDRWTRGEFEFTCKLMDKHPEDVAAGRDLGDDYQTFECVFKNRMFPPEKIASESPWAVYKSGLRKQGTRVPDPHIVTDMAEIKEFLPAQIELGGGASLELGIPPLNHFHMTYNLHTKDGKFIFGDADNLLVRLLTDTENLYAQDVAMPYKKALLAEPNDFYKLMGKMYQDGYIVGPVITNNFDGLCSLVGLQEKFVRKYSEAEIVPKIDFPPEAKSLIVIGSHADRRRIQEAAKNNGMKIIYVDPERYRNYAGEVIEYPLEKVEADDLLVHMPASEFAEKLAAVVYGEPAAETYDCVVVLGGGIMRVGEEFHPDDYQHSDPFGMLGGHMRVIAAKALFDQHSSNAFAFVSGRSKRAAAEHGADAPTGAVVYSNEFLRQLTAENKAFKMPEIIIEDEVHNTYSGLAKAIGLINARGWKSVAILSSDYHLPRIKALCELIKKDQPSNAQVAFLSAEAIVKKAYPGKYDEEIDAAYASPEGQKRLKSEAAGVADIEQGRYEIREYQTNPRSSELIGTGDQQK